MESAKSVQISDGFIWADYLVFGLLLGFSGIIGIFYGCFKKQGNNEEYLMGNRQMKPFPVAISLLCSSMSAITMLGFPAEIYLYGMQVFVSLLVFLPMSIALYKIYCPVFFKLNFTSGYQYFEIRFSRTVRMMVSMLSSLFLIPYMCLVVYGPSVSISLVTGIHHRVSFACIYLVCIFYSTLGGLKAVLFTDVLQGLVMLLSLSSVVIIGFISIGGQEVWRRLEIGHRTEMLILDPDPRRRHTLWTSIFAIFFTWLAAFGSSQANIQRFVCLPSLEAIKRTLIYNFIATTLVISLCFICGMLTFAFYYDCDPLTLKLVKTPDQLLPLFTMVLLRKYPGLPGLFVAGITSASMSTVSSGINALSAIFIEDYIKVWAPKLNEKKLYFLSRIISLSTGLVSFFFVFIAERSSNILAITHSLIGSLYGPILGLFTLGMVFPWAKSKGVILGFISSVGFMVFLSMGAAWVNQKKIGPLQRLPFDTSGCNFGNDTENLSRNFTGFSSEPTWKNKEYSGLINFFSISYNWYSTLGTVLMIIFGLFYSIILDFFIKKKEPISQDYFAPPAIWLWKKLFSQKYLQKYIEFDNSSITTGEIQTSKKNIFQSLMTKWAGRKIHPLPDEIIWSRSSSIISIATSTTTKEDKVI